MKTKMIILSIVAFLVVNTMSYALEVVGHRGSRGTRPENTLASFEAAVQAEADVLHLDLQITKEKKCVIYHDYFINPDYCQYLDGSPVADKLLVHSLSLSEIKKIDCGSKVHPRFPSQVLSPGAEILTLPEFLEWIKGNPHPHAAKIKILVKLKRDARHLDYSLSAEEFAQNVIKEVERSGLPNRVMYASFDADVLAEIRHLDPQAILCFAKAYNLDHLIEIAQSVDVKVISLDQALLTSKEIVGSYHQKGFAVVLWGANEPKRWNELLEMEVDGIITDFPGDLIHFLKEKNKKNIAFSQAHGRNSLISLRP